MADDQINSATNQSSLLSEIEQEDQTIRNRTVTTREIGVQTSPPPSPVESDDEEEVETENHVGPHLQPPSRHELAWTYTQQFSLQALLWFQYLWTLLSYLASTTQTVGKSVIRGLQNRTYVFFQGSNYPYRIQDYTITGPGVSPVEWYYDADKKLFISSNLYKSTTEYTSHHFEWLSAQVKYENLVLHDITEFIQQVKWSGAQRPSPARVLAAWSVDSGIVLNSVQGITLSTINEDGTESSLEVCG